MLYANDQTSVLIGHFGCIIFAKLKLIDFPLFYLPVLECFVLLSAQRKSDVEKRSSSLLVKLLAMIIFRWFCFVPSDIRSMVCLLSFIYKKGYGANHTLLWRTRETSSVKLSFQWWLRQPKNTCKNKCESAVFISSAHLYYTRFSEIIHW